VEIKKNNLHRLPRKNLLENSMRLRRAFSRARGDYSPQSDIDIAIDAPGMTLQNFAQLWSAIDALPIAYPIDCIWLQTLPESTLKVQVERDRLVL
jgi:uncharacterized protein